VRGGAVCDERNPIVATGTYPASHTLPMPHINSIVPTLAAWNTYSLQRCATDSVVEHTQNNRSKREEPEKQGRRVWCVAKSNILLLYLVSTALMGTTQWKIGLSAAYTVLASGSSLSSTNCRLLGQRNRISSHQGKYYPRLYFCEIPTFDLIAKKSMKDNLLQPFRKLFKWSKLANPASSQTFFSSAPGSRDPGPGNHSASINPTTFRILMRLGFMHCHVEYKWPSLFAFTPEVDGWPSSCLKALMMI